MIFTGLAIHNTTCSLSYDTRFMWCSYNATRNIFYF